MPQIAAKGEYCYIALLVRVSHLCLSDDYFRPHHRQGNSNLDFFDDTRLDSVVKAGQKQTNTAVEIYVSTACC